MNENINLVEILKDAPKGTKLWSPLYGDLTFNRVVGDSFINVTCYIENNAVRINIPKDGIFSPFYRNSGLMIFPSKENWDWSTFKVPKALKHFEPFQRVLIKRYRLTGPAIWGAAYYSHYGNNAHYTTTGKPVGDGDIIPYKGNENKLGKPVNE